MNMSEEERRELEKYFDNLSEKEQQEMIRNLSDAIDRDQAALERSLIRLRYIGLATIILVATCVVSLVLRFCTTWGSALNIVDGFVSLGSSGISYWAFTATRQRWRLYPIILLLLTMFNIGMALKTWGVF